MSRKEIIGAVITSFLAFAAFMASIAALAFAHSGH